MDGVIDAMNPYNLKTQNKQERRLSRNNPGIRVRLEDFLKSVTHWRVGGGKKTPPWRLRHLLCTDDLKGREVENITCNGAPSLIQPSTSRGIAGFTPTESLFSSFPGHQEEEFQYLLQLVDAARIMESVEPIESSSSPDFHTTHLYEQNSVTYLAGYTARRTLLRQKTKYGECVNLWEEELSESNKENELYTRLSKYPHDNIGVDQVESEEREVDNIPQPQAQAQVTPHRMPDHRRKTILILVRHSNPSRTRLLATLTEQEERFTSQKFSEWFNKSHPCYLHRKGALESLLLDSKRSREKNLIEE
ncbi:hypothetical protein QAD02_021801 [Eretmocerus hayati]|uniref:Uncharacterized protein n=1 Tax=Eretmocerus hayati TaxID=131215 RepID=A0ACC2PSN9_9HYME|nr:hypothetical protein QAD02_021801 [Eretmocerus hayati]